jgi:hypothetical protein
MSTSLGRVRCNQCRRSRWPGRGLSSRACAIRHRTGVRPAGRPGPARVRMRRSSSGWSRRIMASAPQAGQCFCSYLDGPREHPHDWASPAFSELMRGMTCLPQPHRHSAPRKRLPSAPAFCTSRMTASLPYLSPRLTTCLTIRNIRSKTDILSEPYRLGVSWHAR